MDTKIVIACVVVTVLMFGGSFALTGNESNWPDSRGRTADGVTPVGSVPVKWSVTENVKRFSLPF